VSLTPPRLGTGPFWLFEVFESRGASEWSTARRGETEITRAAETPLAAVSVGSAADCSAAPGSIARKTEAGVYCRNTERQKSGVVTAL